MPAGINLPVLEAQHLHLRKAGAHLFVLNNMAALLGVRIDAAILDQNRTVVQACTLMAL